MMSLLVVLDKNADTPFHHQSVEHIRLGYRRCVFKRDAIYYRIGEDAVEIMAILVRQDQANRAL
jgi:toxin ParE1/3/4